MRPSEGTMTEWFYKATGKKVDRPATQALLTADGFLCRCAFKTTGARISHVKDVQVGDIIHAYYVDRPGIDRRMGVYEVVDPTGHTSPATFVGAVADTGALQLVDPAFSRRL